MEKYRNVSGVSNVAEYKISMGSIVVKFKDGTAYLYTADVTGAALVAEMQRRASIGKGLNTYIKTVVKDKHARRLWL